MTDEKLTFLTLMVAGWMGLFEPCAGFFALLLVAGIRAWIGFT